MTTIDSDAHVIESERTWSYLAEDERHFAPLVLDIVSGEIQPQTGPRPATQYWFSGDFIQTKDNADTVSMDEESREMGNVATRLAHMDALDIDMQILYPTIFLAPCARDAAQEAAQYRAYNRWLADIWQLAGGRLRWAACAPMYSLHKVRDELAFAKDHGACCVFVRPFECDRYVGGGPISTRCSTRRPSWIWLLPSIRAMAATPTTIFTRGIISAASSWR